MKQLYPFAKTAFFSKINPRLAVAIPVLMGLFILIGQTVFGQVSGTVFRDFNASGAKDNSATFNEPFLSGVIVTAYNSAGTILASYTTTGAAYSIPSSGSYNGTPGSNTGGVPSGTAVRIEFTGLGIGDYAGPNGTGSATSVQFKTAPATNVNFGVNYPGDYCQATPKITVPCYIAGPAGSGTSSALVNFTYGAYTTGNGSGKPNMLASGSGVENPGLLAKANEIGSTWGTGYQRSYKRLFASTFLKRHIGILDGTGYVYIVDPLAGTAVQGKFNLNGVTPSVGATINTGSVTRVASPSTDNNYLGAVLNRDMDAFSKVGTISFGDIDIDEENNKLWLVNLNQKTLISVDVSGTTASLNGASAATLAPLTKAYDITTLPGIPTATGGQIRPWALEFYKGTGYLGVVADASTSTAANLKAYVLKFDPNNVAAGFTTAITFNLNYNRENSGYFNNPTRNWDGKWSPWSNTYTGVIGPTGASSLWQYHSPILTDIQMLDNGSMVIGLSDRVGFQIMENNPQPLAGSSLSSNFVGSHFAAGDIIQVCWNGSAFVLEGASGCADADNGEGTTSSTPTNVSNDGPGNTGEFYYQDYFTADVTTGLNTGSNLGHNEITTGGLTFMPGKGQVLSTAFDPLEKNANPASLAWQFNQQGIVWFSTTDGKNNGGYTLVDGGSGASLKGNGLGDLETLCDPQPLEIGNRVWMDTDGDGIQDAGEMGISGLTVLLFQGAVQKGSTTTDANGNYYFTAANVTGGVLPTTAYEIRIATGQGGLTGKILTPTDAGGSDLVDNDGTTSGTNAIKAFTTGTAGQNNHSYDFGFRACTLTATANGTNVSCNGGSTGSATATPSGNIGSVTYLWSNGATMATISGLAAGTYTVTVTETPTCTATASYTVIQPTVLSILCSKTDVTTNGGADGTASVAPSGGTPGYTYLWSSGQTTASISGLVAGTYIVTVTDSKGCTKTCSSQVNQPGCNLTASASGSNVTCFGGNNGGAVVTPSGNAGAVTYFWSNGATTAGISGLTAGTYLVTVTESPTCTATANYVVTQPPVLSVICAKTDATTNGGADGTASVSANGGSPSYGYLWSSGQTTAAISGLVAGTYTVTVTDANNCTATCTATVGQPAPVCSLAVTSATPSVCNPATNTYSLTVVVTYSNPPATGNISISTSTGGAISVAQTSSPQTITLTGLNSDGAAGIDVSAFFDNDNACQNTLVAAYDAPVTCSCPATTYLICPGESYTLTAQAGLTNYQWFTIAGVDTTAISGQTNQVYVATAIGKYIWKATDGNGCQIKLCCPVDIVAGVCCNMTVVATGQNVCEGTALTISATANAGWTYEWTLNGTPVSTSNPIVINAATPADAGTYSVTATETATGCTASATATATVFPAVDAAIVNTSISCMGNTSSVNINTSVTGGTPAITYAWTIDPNPAVISTASSPTFSTTGLYKLTVTDSHSCTDEATVQVNAPDPISTSNIVENVLCNGASTGKITINAAGGTLPFTIVYKQSATTLATHTVATAPVSDFLASLLAGSYQVEIMDGNQCMITIMNIVITEPAALAANCSKTDATTIGGADGTASVAPSGGMAPYTYLWSNGATTSGISGLAVGTYSVTVTDANGCTAPCSVQIAEPTCNLTANTYDASVPCFGDQTGVLTANAFGQHSPVTYLWSIGATTNSISGLAAGPYSVTITEAATCTVTSTYNVTEPPVLVAICSKTDVTTLGGTDGTASVASSDGTPGYTYLWSNGATTASISGLAAGTYTVTVTDANGCTNSCSSTVNDPGCTQPSAPTLSQTAPTCTSGTANNDGKITLAAVTGGDKYGVSTGAVYSGTPNYAAATAIGTFPQDLQTAIPNAGATYTIRFFNGSDACFKDSTLTVAPVCCQTTSTLASSHCAGDGFSQTVGTTVFNQANPSGAVILTNAAGCDSTVMVNLTFVPAANAGTAATPGPSICAAPFGLVFIDLFAQIAGEGTGGVWAKTSGPAVGINFDANAGTLDPNGLTAGSYVFEYTVTGTSPCPNDSEPVTITINDCAIPCPPKVCLPIAVEKSVGGN